MNKHLYKLTLFLSIFLFTGCFEVIEEIQLNDNGSGSVTITANLSRSKTKIVSIMLMDSINGHKVPSKAEINKEIAKIVSEIKNIKGVSAVQHSEDFDDFIFSISCNFTNVDVLNKVIAHFNKINNTNVVTKVKQFSYNKKTKTFVRNHGFNLKKEMQKVGNKDREIFNNASITTIYRFESPILSSKNRNARISKSKKAIMLHVPIDQIINHQNNIKNIIKLK